MKKILTTAMVLGTLIGVANASDRITSPLYMPKAGDTLSETRIGYSKDDWKYDRYVGTDNDYEAKTTRGVFREDLAFGIRDDWSFNFGFTYDFNQKRERDYAANASDVKYKDNSTFRNTYFGLTKRFIDDQFKLDLLAKVWIQGDYSYLDGAGTARLRENKKLDLAVRGGAEVTDMYDTALTLGWRYLPEENTKNTTALGTTVNKTQDNKRNDFYVRWENEINPITSLTLGVNGTYERIGKRRSVSKLNEAIVEGPATSYIIRSQDVWGVDGNVSYLVNDKVAVGAYVDYRNFRDAKTYEVTATGARAANPYSTDKSRDVLEYGLKTSLKF
jgi:opacity protein-like surface antigen